ncbi:MAG TPA: ATP-binding protein [Steroidobacteraceae bacterium]|jgi:two-component system sensor histidine kinase CpxA
MRSLYVRIFVAFWIAMVLALACSVIATLWLADQRLQREQGRQEQLAHAASEVLAQSGEAGLRDWLSRESARAAPDRLYVLDRHGNDLLGRRTPEFLRARGGRDGGPGPPPPPEAREAPWLSQLISPSDGETYTLSLLRARRGPLGIFRSSQLPLVTTIATLLVSAIVCFLLARHLSDPIRHLRAATRSIAAGDLGVQVSSLMGQRRDELALLALDFDRMAERLRALLASHRELLRDVSHELRSPLARLQIALGLARRPNANLEQEFDRIEQETARLDALIGEILSLSSLDDPARALQLEAVDLEELLETLLDNTRVEAGERGIQISLQGTPSGSIEGDRELLFRALENVLRNAVRFSPRDGSIEFGVAQEMDAVVLRVRDHGPGVPPEALERIFEPFASASQARERESSGHGIGLAITARVVALHRGRVCARNAAGGGLEVELRLPQRQPPGTPS